jgi:predicted membrane channel-forming protein YqfA (hemolysin III family)
VHLQKGKPVEGNLKNVGGTPGGVGEFFIGLALTVAGAYWLTQQVEVSSGMWTIYGYNSFGLSLVPFLLGMVILFANGKSFWGHALVFIGVIIILAGILMNLRIYFQPTSLFNTLLMLGLLAAGVGLVIKSLRPHLDSKE